MFTSSPTSRRGWPVTLGVIVIGVAASCTGSPETGLERLVEARQLSADLLVQFTKAANAANLAVMADTDDASAVFVHDAELATQAVQKDDAALRPILIGLGYSNEAGLLGEFTAAFTEYLALDRTILGLAVENTNLKAQRLSFGSAQETADAFTKAVESVRPTGASDTWQVAAIVAGAVARVREIQVVQARHIAEADDATMTGLEKRMADGGASARSALQMLDPLVAAASRPQLAAATSALDRFMGVSAEIVALSRRNSNVRSLALSLGQKRMLTAKCEETLNGLQTALTKRQFGGTR